MSTNTEQKILDAALKVFSENGYTGARTRIIAEKSGFTEMTLFRKFETKENLFNKVLTVNKQRVMEDVNSLLVLDEEVTDPKAQFKALVLNLVDLVDKNFEYVNIIVYERDNVSNSITEIFILHLSKYLEEIFTQKKVDPTVLAYMILSFLYFITLNRKTGQACFDLDKAVEEFIDYHSRCLEV
ncbi:TetR/AcrR family transcriptional regulator [uncultured Methanobacterium sp.]|uniref:TetR/AcrR family transcriptional regulator n=1 Tax=uncultured Methanobacterium sp. TaxID=176306 RepID=UPI002AA9246B|nr:TetR/AcrR family transcriptional regulator [uncultured Methanobacterium sp.]